MVENILFWAATGLIGFLLLIVGFFMAKLVSEISEFRSSLIEQIDGVKTEMSGLNEKLAVVITNQDWHAKEITRLDSRMSKIEDQ